MGNGDSKSEEQQLEYIRRKRMGDWALNGEPTIGRTKPAQIKRRKFENVSKDQSRKLRTEELPRTYNHHSHKHVSFLETPPKEDYYSDTHKHRKTKKAKKRSLSTGKLKEREKRESAMKCKTEHSFEDEINEILPVHGIPHVCEVKKYDDPSVFHCFLCNVGNLKSRKDLINHILGEKHEMALVKEGKKETNNSNLNCATSSATDFGKSRKHDKIANSRKRQISSVEYYTLPEEESHRVSILKECHSKRKQAAIPKNSGLSCRDTKHDSHSRIKPPQNHFIKNTLRQIEYFNSKMTVPMIPKNGTFKRTTVDPKEQRGIKGNVAKRSECYDSITKFSDFLNWILTKLDCVDVCKEDIKLLDETIYKLKALSAKLKTETSASDLQKAFKDFIVENGIDVNSFSDPEQVIQPFYLRTPTTPSSSFGSEICSLAKESEDSTVENGLGDRTFLEQTPPCKLQARRKPSFNFGVESQPSAFNVSYLQNLPTLSQLANLEPIPGLTLLNCEDINPTYSK